MNYIQKTYNVPAEYGRRLCLKINEKPVTVRCTSPVFVVVECDRCTATHYWHGEREITCRVCGCVIEVRADQDDVSELADYLEKYNEKT